MRIDKLILLIAVIFLAFSVYSRYSTDNNEIRKITITDFLMKFDSGKYSRVFSIGKSVLGEPILAISLTDPAAAANIGSKARILIIAGQHPCERNPIKAVCYTVELLSNTENEQMCEALRRAVVVMIPVANPDVYEQWGRYNAYGIDLNRDWIKQSQPETRAIERFVRSFKPHIIVDSHEGQPNKTEIPVYGNTKTKNLCMLLAREAASSASNRSLKLTPSYNSPSLSKGLMHRHFADRNICAMLLESYMEIPGETKVDMYSRFYIKLIHSSVLSKNHNIRNGMKYMARIHTMPTLDLKTLYKTER